MKRKWIYGIRRDELNEIAVVEVRISDNVLDEKDWPVYILRFDEKGICIRQTVENKGIYTFDDFVGENLNRLYEWSNYDTTGSEGELSHDLCILAYF